jgi:predicted RND superfamily exporter protein
MIEKFDYQPIEEWLTIANFLIHKVKSNPEGHSPNILKAMDKIVDVMESAEYVKESIISYNQLVIESKNPDFPYDREQLAEDGKTLQRIVILLGNSLEKLSKDIYTSVEFESIVSKI